MYYKLHSIFSLRHSNFHNALTLQHIGYFIMNILLTLFSIFLFYLAYFSLLKKKTLISVIQ